jgi:diacylglycerol O-acyltransferase
MDAMLLYSETPNLPMHTLKAAVVSTADFDGDSATRRFAGHCSGECICWTRCATDWSTSLGGCTIRCGWRTAMSTWTTNRSADRISGNEIGGLPVSLPVHIGDPLERLRLTALSASNAKEDNEIRGTELIPRAMDYLPSALAPPVLRWLSQRDAHNKMMNVPVSNVPGPRERGHFGGAPVTEIYSTGVLSPGVGINITVWSYVEQMDISILADDRTFTDVHEVTDAMVDAFIELRLAAGLPAELTPLATAMPPATARG